MILQILFIRAASVIYHNLKGLSHNILIITVYTFVLQKILHLPACTCPQELWTLGHVTTDQRKDTCRCSS